MSRKPFRKWYIFMMQKRTEERTETHACDLISRQAAIDALMEFDKKLRKINWYQYPYTEHECRGVDKAIVKIENLPSAQPEKRTEERTETHACDLISRQAAIDAMEDVDWYHIKKDGQLTHGANSEEDEPLYRAEDVYKVLNDVPSAQPEIVRCKECKHGEQDEYGRWYCRGFGCQVGDEDGNGFCSDAERKNNV